MSGDKSKIEQMKSEVDQGSRIEFSKEKDINNVTGLIKLYLQSLPNPLLTYDLYDSFSKSIKSM